MSTAWGISEVMMERIREALVKNDGTELFEIPGMKGYFGSHSDAAARPGISYLFGVVVDGKAVHVYLRI